jgi:hypothetical protein
VQFALCRIVLLHFYQAAPLRGAGPGVPRRVLPWEARPAHAGSHSVRPADQNCSRVTLAACAWPSSSAPIVQFAPAASMAPSERRMQSTPQTIDPAATRTGLAPAKKTETKWGRRTLARPGLRPGQDSHDPAVAVRAQARRSALRSYSPQVTTGPRPSRQRAAVRHRPTARGAD